MITDALILWAAEVALFASKVAVAVLVLRFLDVL